MSINKGKLSARLSIVKSKDNFLFSDEMLLHILRSSYTLTEEQRLRVHSDIASLSSRNIVNRCFDSKKRAIDQRAMYRSLLAPVRRLPPEVLDHIFAIYGTTSSNRIHGSKGVFLPGLVFMAVCKQWRVIAESCFALWSNLNILLQFDTVLRELAALQALEWCLDHSGDCVPIDFALQGDTTIDSRLMERLFSQASRWRCISFSFYFDIYPSFPANTLLPSLEALSIEYPYSHDMDADTMHFPCGTEKKLSILSLRRCSEDRMKHLKHLPSQWRQIVGELNLAEYYVEGDDYLFQVLALFPATRILKYCFNEDEITLISHPQDMPIPIHIGPSQTSSSVVSLSVSIERPPTQPYHLHSLLDASSFPNLKTLSIRFFAWYLPYDSYQRSIVFAMPFWPEENLSAFLLRSKCSLTSLDIRNAPLTDADLISLLNHTPDLQHLTIHQNYWISERFPKSLTMGFVAQLHVQCRIASGTVLLVPKLRRLSLCVLGNWFNNDRLFVDVVLSRRTSDQVESLKSLELKVLGRPLDERAYKPLKQLDGRGMRVEVFGSTKKRERYVFQGRDRTKHPWRP